MWGRRILANLELIKYLADSIGKTKEYIKLEDKYGAEFVKNDDGVVTYERGWIEGECTSETRKQLEKERREFLKGIASEGEIAFTMSMELDGSKKPVVFTWETKNIEKLTEGLVELFTENKDALAKVGFNSSLAPRGYESTLIKSLIKM